jgi:antitoxin VapB
LTVIDLYTPLVYTCEMTQSTVFKTNKTQAVRIPKAMAFPDHVKKVKIVMEGKSLVITPLEDNWEAFFKRPGIGDDFERPPKPPMQIREDDHD